VQAKSHPQHGTWQPKEEKPTIRSRLWLLFLAEGKKYLTAVGEGKNHRQTGMGGQEIEKRRSTKKLVCHAWRIMETRIDETSFCKHGMTFQRRESSTGG
jgi:hypothetical protein